MPNVMATLPNIGDALCSATQSLADAQYWSAMQQRCQSRNPLKLAGVPKLPDRSQPLVGWSSPHCGDMWRGYCCLVIFFRVSIHFLVANSPTNLCDGAQMVFFGDFLRPVFSTSSVMHVLNLHLKFALRPHHVWKYGRHPICDGWD